MADPYKELDVRFIPANEVDILSNIHSRTMDFTRAQNALFGTIVQDRGIDKMAYGEFVQHSARRILSS
jgi:hypothetical protein